MVLFYFSEYLWEKMSLSNLSPKDLRNEFIKMYEENLSRTEPQNIINAMVETWIDIRKELEPKLAEELKNIDVQKNLKKILLSEYKIFGFLSDKEAPKLFAEYMLFSLLKTSETEKIINKKYLKKHIEKGLLLISPDLKKELFANLCLFPWSKL